MLWNGLKERNEDESTLVDLESNRHVPQNESSMSLLNNVDEEPVRELL